MTEYLNNPCELTSAERSTIRKLVVSLCANYDRDYGCLMLDGDCYMFYGVAYSNTGMCEYFRKAVLPTDPVLEATLTGSGALEMRPCAFCGASFPVKGRQAYCSDVCTGKSQRRRNREFMRKKRSR